MRIETDKARGHPGTFQTRAFYFACFLRCTGYKLVNLRVEGQRRNDVIAFYGEAASARSHSLPRSRT